jgi:hypothetical protein
MKTDITGTAGDIATVQAWRDVPYIELKVDRHWEGELFLTTAEALDLARALADAVEEKTR